MSVTKQALRVEARRHERAAGAAAPIYVLVDAVTDAVIAYDRTDDHDWSHNGIADHDCIRCHVVDGLPPASRLRIDAARRCR